MKTKNQTKLLKIIFTLFVSFLLLFMVSGCQTTDKTNSYLATSNVPNAQLEYTPTANRTRVRWSSTLTNDTIYDIDEFEITFRLYEGDSYRTETYTYSGVEHGKKLRSNFQFHADGKIDYIEYVSWTAHYDSFWDTYKVAIFITASIAALAAIVYIIAMIVNDLDFDDMPYFLPFVISGCTLLSILGFLSSWVLAFIIAGGILSALLIAVIAQAIHSFFF